MAMVYERFPAAVERARAEPGPDRSVAEVIDEFLAEEQLDHGPNGRRARQVLRSVIEAEAADMSEHQSMRWMWNELEYGGSYFGDMPAGGYRSLTDQLAHGVDVRLGVEVTDVHLTPDGVVVRAADGSAHSGTHVVVTVPLGVLKQGRPRFTPPLPADRVAAIDRLGFGTLEKVVLRFDSPWWRSSGYSHLMLFPHHAEEATVWVFDLDAFGAGPTLAAMVFQSATPHVLSGTADESAQWLLGMLGQAVGGSCPAPTHVAATAWAKDPFSAGAYTHIPVGAQPADPDLLGAPVCGRVLFAGEHTQSARVAYADGALSSGVREAKRLLGGSSVLLGPLS
jgi:polyamine oxidase